jgi:ArsR family transcriptional regulator
MYTVVVIKIILQHSFYDSVIPGPNGTITSIHESGISVTVTDCQFRDLSDWYYISDLHSINMQAGSIKDSFDQYSRIFKALGERNRLHIITLLSQKELCVCELVDLLGISQSNVSQHLAKLKSVNLVRERRGKQWIFYSINPERKKVLDRVLELLPDVSGEIRSIDLDKNPERCRLN